MGTAIPPWLEKMEKLSPPLISCLLPWAKHKFKSKTYSEKIISSTFWKSKKNLFSVTSRSHIFISFFKIFLLICLFGLFHGLVTLPVVLACIGATEDNSGKIWRRLYVKKNWKPNLKNFNYAWTRFKNGWFSRKFVLSISRFEPRSIGTGYWWSSDSVQIL